MLRATRKIMVEWGDCDPAEIVFYPKYFEYFNASTERLFSFGDMNKIKILKKYNAVGFPMMETSSKFIKPSKYGDLIKIDSEVIRVGNSSFSICHRLYNTFDELNVECIEHRVWTIRNANNQIVSCPMPDEVRSHLTSEERLSFNY